MNKPVQVQITVEVKGGHVMVLWATSKSGLRQAVEFLDCLLRLNCGLSLFRTSTWVEQSSGTSRYLRIIRWDNRGKMIWPIHGVFLRDE